MSFRILHLSDLHVETDTSLFESLWAVAKEQLAGPFDFVVVSGDISNHGKEEQFRTAAQLVNKLLLPLVANRRARVILVPGNHDLLWGQTLGEHRVPNATELAGQHFARSFYDSMSRPDDRQQRFVWGPAGVTSVITLDAYQYQSRFGPFASFYEKVYPPANTPELRKRMALLDIDRSFHWSAHVFPDEKVVFLGFSSCDSTDEFSRGACIHERAINAARDYLEKELPDYTRIAVWHHGLVSPRGDADYVTMRELAALSRAGMHLGLHGHTHKESQRDFADVIPRPFPLLGTGSLTVEHNKLADAGRKQFSIIEVNRIEARWSRFELSDPSTGSWNVTQSSHSLPRGPRPPVSVPTNVARLHQRAIDVDEDGIARVQVRLEHGRALASTVLACPGLGYNNLEADSKAALTWRRSPGSLEVREWKSDGERGFSTVKPADFEVLEWAFYMSNGFALDKVDAQNGAGRHGRMLGLATTHDAYVHLVQFPVEELVLELKLPHKNAKNVTPVAHAPATGTSRQLRWEAEPSEAAAIELQIPAPDPASGATPAGPTDHVRVRVPAPRTGHLYGFTYELTGTREPLPRRSHTFLAKLIHNCRNATPAQPSHGALNREVSAMISHAVGYVFGLPKRRNRELGLWVGRIWDPSTEQLEPCFGNFPSAFWATAFRYGQGIAGHAFRKRGPAVYELSSNGDRDLDSGRRTRLLYAKPKQGASSRQWIVEVPILVTENEPAIGTVGFSDEAGNTIEDQDVSQRLAELANTLVTDYASAAAERQLLDRLTQRVSHLFWLATYELHPWAKEVFEMHWKDWKGKDAKPEQKRGSGRHVPSAS